ncbi:hypothetical protein [Nocardia sputi]|uniref:hypothetical protein n=1 Tax=Nocardia sputi TaxID=2943705 RepID=UPI00355702A0
MGAALGVSDQTVARRYRKLRSTGALRVLGLTDARRLGHVEWLVRLRCVPGAAEPIATALAAQTPPRSASPRAAPRSSALHEPAATSPATAGCGGKLPRTPRVVAVTAHCLLRMFFGGATGWNGRSESTIHRRLEHLRHTGTLFFDVDIDPRLLGFTCEAMLWLPVPPRQTRRPRSHPRHPPRSRLRRRHHRTDQPRRPLDALAGYGAGLWIATGARRPRTLTLAEFDLAGLWVVHTHPTRPSMLVRGRRGPIDTAPLRSPAIRHKEELLFERALSGVRGPDSRKVALSGLAINPSGTASATADNFRSRQYGSLPVPPQS